MTLRPPQQLSYPGLSAPALNVLEYELMSERADALGRHGLKVEKALARLRAGLQAGCSGDQRENLLNDVRRMRSAAMTFRLKSSRGWGSFESAEHQ